MEFLMIKLPAVYTNLCRCSLNKISHEINLTLIKMEPTQVQSQPGPWTALEQSLPDEAQVSLSVGEAPRTFLARKGSSTELLQAGRNKMQERLT